MSVLIKKPIAWIPIAVPLAFLIYIAFTIGRNGIPQPDPNADEGIGAHLFQIWIILNPLMIGYFAFRWLSRAPKQALLILLLQISLSLLLIFTVFSLKL